MIGETLIGAVIGTVIGIFLAQILIQIIQYIDYIRWKKWFYGNETGIWAKFPYNKKL